LAVGDALLELVGLAAQLRVIEFLKLRLERIDARDLSRQLAQHAVIAAAEYARQGTVEHRRSGWLWNRGSARARGANAHDTGRRRSSKGMAARMGRFKARASRHPWPGVPGGPSSRAHNAIARVVHGTHPFGPASLFARAAGTPSHIAQALGFSPCRSDCAC